MKNWSTLFVRHGFTVEEISHQSFNCAQEGKGNMSFLLETLDILEVSYQYDNDILIIHSKPAAEKDFIHAVDFRGRGVTGQVAFWKKTHQVKLKSLDTYICGVIRQLYRLGLCTDLSCDGNGRRSAIVSFRKKENEALAEKIFLAAGIREVQHHRLYLQLRINDRKELLEAAERMSAIQKDWLTQDAEYMKKMLFLTELETLLQINGESGNEAEIRSYVAAKLAPFVDHQTVDAKGNILAQKTFGSGRGPTILLNAHLDTVYSIVPGREIVKEGNIWFSSEGILGADDRAGVAVVLETARRLQKSRFNGKVKFIFTVEEEIGLQGSKKVDEFYLKDVDAAIVVDRRGTGDIVTSHGGHFQFCDELYGDFLRKTAMKHGLEGWQTVAGGSSDTKIWAEQGIQSVNLSAGYWNEHTEEEKLDTEACYGTVKLIERVFKEGQELQRALVQIRRGRRHLHNNRKQTS
ncbi:M20/M25/M40 family metallo-hydrolase [Alkalicoccus daliensis]|uniref:Peptidase family M28 n=1 Tax=Alkalicoccus daliensis TaxID=745820 RepID=A0A1H0E7B0_9BACI|nr:M20/M25/M40 family metallo-hydrolase [Alkalicoccus daliensis]SDN78307.1 Peptidase family M28 [Alkalicoccus daliensis]